MIRVSGGITLYMLDLLLCRPVFPGEVHGL